MGGTDIRPINQIVIHCSDTYPDMDIGVDEIRHWHTVDNGWSDVGYHFVIRRSGVIETGRPIEKAGAHAAGHNIASVGVCVVGGKARAGRQPCNFTARQWASLAALVDTLKRDHPTIESVIGHNDVSSKTCPTFDVAAWTGE